MIRSILYTIQRQLFPPQRYIFPKTAKAMIFPETIMTAILYHTVPELLLPLKFQRRINIIIISIHDGIGVGEL